MEEQLVNDSIDYIISLMDNDGRVFVKDQLKILVCISYINRNNAEERAKLAFNEHKQKKLQ